MLSKIQSLIAAFGLLFFALVSAFWAGKRKEKEEQQAEELNEYIETRRRIDDALSNPDLNTATEFLRKRKSDRNL